jgi:hypothetical protein
MGYLPWQKFMADRAPSSIFCFRVRWSDGTTRPTGAARPGRTAARPTPAPPPSAKPRGPRTLTLRSAPPVQLAEPPPAPKPDEPIPLPGKLKKWLTDNCSGRWSLNRMHSGRVCILGFESSNDYMKAVTFLAPNGPWRPTSMPACAAARTTDVDEARLRKLFAPPVPAAAR